MSPLVKCKSLWGKEGATVLEYDQVFYAGLPLSAVVAFHLPFSQFTCWTDSRCTAAPSVGERWELHAGWIGDLANGAAVKLHSCNKWKNTASLIFWQIGPPLRRLWSASFTDTSSARTCTGTTHVHSNLVKHRKMAALTNTHTVHYAYTHTHTRTHAKHCFFGSECFAGVAIKGYQRAAVSAESQAGGCTAVRWNKFPISHTPDPQCACSRQPALIHAYMNSYQCKLPQACAQASLFLQTALWAPHISSGYSHVAWSSAQNWDRLTNGRSMTLAGAGSLVSYTETGDDA